VELTEDELSLMQSGLSKRKSGKPLSGVAQDFLHALRESRISKAESRGVQKDHGVIGSRIRPTSSCGGVSAQRNLKANVKREKMPLSFG
jgi:hypothetical protein